MFVARRSFSWWLQVAPSSHLTKHMLAISIFRMCDNLCGPKPPPRLAVSINPHIFAPHSIVSANRGRHRLLYSEDTQWLPERWWSWSTSRWSRFAARYSAQSCDRYSWHNTSIKRAIWLPTRGRRTKTRYMCGVFRIFCELITIIITYICTTLVLYAKSLRDMDIGLPTT